MGLFDFVRGIGHKLFGKEDDVAQKIREHINANNPGIKDLKVDYKDGTAVLSGTADSAEAMEKAATASIPRRGRRWPSFSKRPSSRSKLRSKARRCALRASNATIYKKQSRVCARRNSTCPCSSIIFATSVARLADTTGTRRYRRRPCRPGGRNAQRRLACR